MLVKLPPETVKENWEFIYQCIYAALPEFATKDERTKSRLYKYIMEDILDVWAYLVEPNSENPQLYAIATTMIQGDEVIGNRHLLIYTFFLVQHGPDEYWQDGMFTFMKWAKANRCSHVTAYTKRTRMIQFSRKVPGVNELSYFMFPLGEGGAS